MPTLFLQSWPDTVLRTWNTYAKVIITNSYIGYLWYVNVWVTMHRTSRLSSPLAICLQLLPSLLPRTCDHMSDKLWMFRWCSLCKMALAKRSANSGQFATVSSPEGTAKKILHTRCLANESTQLYDPNENNSHKHFLSGDARDLKELLLASSSYKRHLRFSFSKLRHVVVPPVQIPAELATPRAVSNTVAGVRIPMTKAMWTWRRARLMRRLPRRVDEEVAW